VPAGGSCIILFGSTVGHDVLGFSPLGVHVNGGGPVGGGSVGHDVIINGVTGRPYSFPTNTVCNNVADNVVISNAASTAVPWSIGDRNGSCGGAALTIGNDLVLFHNAGPIEVEDISSAFGGNIRHDLIRACNTPSS
jgi:hypothetical protein